MSGASRYLSFGRPGWTGGRPRDSDGQLLDETATRSSVLPVSQPAGARTDAGNNVPPVDLSVPAPERREGERSIAIDPRQILRGLERVGLGLKDVILLYWNDIFHTMLTMPRGRFLAIFFCVYFLEYIVFALLYLSVKECITGAHSFALALWFSVRTATTIGYNDQLQPSVTCTSINLLITFQVICAALIDYCMMGLVFARFATPTARASSVKFSSTATVHQQDNGTWALSFRVANFRKHHLLHPEASLFLVVPDSQGTSSLQFEEMHIAGHKSHMANLRLGVPTLITHIITPDSPMFDLSIDLMQQRGIELLVFLDAIDPMTSNNMAARWSFAPHDLRMNRRFGTLDTLDRRNNTVLNFGAFNSTVPGVMHPAPASQAESDALAYRTIRSLTPMALSPSVLEGAGSGAFLGTISNGNTHSMATGNVTWQAPGLLERERQLSALCEAVMRDQDASPELRHLAAAAAFGGPRTSSGRVLGQFPLQPMLNPPPSSTYSLHDSMSMPDPGTMYGQRQGSRTNQAPNPDVLYSLGSDSVGTHDPWSTGAPGK